MINIFNYITQEEYEYACNDLNNGVIKNIYNEDGIEIDLKKVGKKVYKFIAIYGEEDANKCIEDMYHRRTS
ncbi:MAG: hypothetical protein ACRCVJ_14090 [Clostridium sp.]|uniref:hypothetical protein n=1 Tax=Clostridium sp. TaxID=1506 RepID=UPI003F3AC889